MALPPLMLRMGGFVVTCVCPAVKYGTSEILKRIYLQFSSELPVQYWQLDKFNLFIL